MTYTSYTQIVADVNYPTLFDCHDNPGFFDPYRRSGNFIARKTIKKLKKIWTERIAEKYESTKKTKSGLGKFLSRFPLKFKEFLLLIELIEGDDEQSEIERALELEGGIREYRDLFKKHRVRYESSQLKRYKLVYRITNPLKPMKSVYEVSYLAQLALKNKKYTDEYQQLDMALEEDAKRNSPDALESLYYVIEPKSNFSDLVASHELVGNLKAALSREMKKEQIFKKWGFGKVIEYGRGTTLNFRGLPGTGKTLAAHCLAKELDKKLLMVRYDQLQSCFIGATEKHIQRIFKIAKAKNAVLFFDEADAIATDRKDAVYSWEMSQINTLLKELERFDGVCIFATNFSEKYDGAFERRLTMHIDFPMPNKEQGLLIIEKLLPRKSRDRDLVLEKLDFSGFSGGDLKNVALNAAGIAVKEDSDKITGKHLEEAIKLVRKGKQICEHRDMRYIS